MLATIHLISFNQTKELFNLRIDLSYKAIQIQYDRLPM